MRPEPIGRKSALKARDLGQPSPPSGPLTRGTRLAGPSRRRSLAGIRRWPAPDTQRNVTGACRPPTVQTLMRGRTEIHLPCGGGGEGKGWRSQLLPGWLHKHPKHRVRPGLCRLCTEEHRICRGFPPALSTGNTLCKHCLGICFRADSTGCGGKQLTRRWPSFRASHIPRPGPTGALLTTRKFRSTHDEQEAVHQAGQVPQVPGTASGDVAFCSCHRGGGHIPETLGPQDQRPRTGRPEVTRLICWIKGHNWTYRPWHNISACTRCPALTERRS